MVGAEVLLIKAAPYLASVAEGFGAKQVAQALIVIGTGVGGAGGKGAVEALTQLLRPAREIVQRRNELSAVKNIGTVKSATRNIP
jgi:hypothetical protein